MTADLQWMPRRAANPLGDRTQLALALEAVRRHTSAAATPAGSIGRICSAEGLRSLINAAAMMADLIDEALAAGVRP